MKKRIISTLSLLCASVSTGFALTPEEGKKFLDDMRSDIQTIVKDLVKKVVAFIDPMAIIQKQPDELKDENERIKKEYDRRVKEFNTLKETVMKKEAELKAIENTLNDAAKEKRKEELVNLYTQAQLKEKGLQEYMQRVYQELEGKMLKKIQAAADEIARQEGLIIVLAGGIVYSDEKLDISDKVFKKMNEQYNQEKKKKGAKPEAPIAAENPTPKTTKAN
jgi:Skp family chaperone for outer membrane proteins